MANRFPIKLLIIDAAEGSGDVRRRHRLELGPGRNEGIGLGHPNRTWICNCVCSSRRRVTLLLVVGVVN